jgi:hypothetical protein
MIKAEPLPSCQGLVFDQIWALRIPIPSKDTVLSGRKSAPSCIVYVVLVYTMVHFAGVV